MTEEEINRIAELVSQKVSIQYDGCKVFDDETIQDIKKFMRHMRAGTQTAVATIVGILITATIGAIGLGIVAWIRSE